MADEKMPLNDLEQLAGYYAVQLGHVSRGQADRVKTQTREKLRKQNLIHRVPVERSTPGGVTLPLWKWELTEEGDRLYRQAYEFLMTWLKVDLEGTV